MYPFFRQILKIRPQALNSIPERLIKEADVREAIDNGYVIDAITPAYLLKYEVMAQKYLQCIDEGFEYDYSLITDERIIVLLQHIKKDNFTNNLLVLVGNLIGQRQFSDKCRENIFNVLKENMDLLSKYSYKLSHLIQTEELFYDYIDFDPTYFTSGVDYSFIKDYERLYNVLQKHLSVFIYSAINLELFKVWFKHQPEILLEEHLNSQVYDSKDFAELFNEAFTNGQISLEDVKQKNVLINDYIYPVVLKKDFANIKYFIGVNVNYNQHFNDFIFDLLLNNFNENVKYLSYMSLVIDEYNVYSDYKQKIIDNLVANDIVVTDCSWNFIKNSVSVMYHSFLKNHSIINDDNFLISPDRELTQAEIDSIVNIIRSDNVIADKITTFIAKYPEIMMAVLVNNPYAIDKADGSLYAVNTVKLSELMQNGYEISVTSSSIVFSGDNFDTILKALEKNINILNNPRFNIICSSDERMLKLYNVLHAHNYLLTADSPECLFNNYLLVLKSLESKSITLSDLSEMNSINDTSVYAGMLREYLLENYSHEEIQKEVPNMYYANQKITAQLEDVIGNRVVIALKNDFANCINFPDNIIIVDRFYKEISELYFANYEQNKQFYGKNYPIIDKNPYINLYECLIYHRDMMSVDCLNYDCRRIFMDSYQDAGIEIKGNLIKLFKYEELAEIVKKHPERIDEWTPFLKSWGLLDSYFVSAVCECIKDGTYTIKNSIPSELAESLLEFAVTNDIPHIGILIRNATSVFYMKDKLKDYMYDFLIAKKVTAKEIGYERVLQLDSNQLMQIFKTNPENLIILNSIMIQRDRKIKKLINNPEFQKMYEAALKNYICYDVRKVWNSEYSIEELLIIGTKNPTILLNKYVYEQYPSLDGETYNKFRNLVIKAYKNNQIKLDSNVARNYILIHKDNGEIDEEFMDYLLNNSLSDYIKCLRDNMPEFYKQKLYEAFDKLDSIEMKINSFKFDEADSNIYRELVTRTVDVKHMIYYASPKAFTEQEIYNYWLEAGCPLDTISDRSYLLKNKLIILTALRQDINNYKYFDYEPKNDERDWGFEYQVFEIFNAQNSISPFASNLFYNNSYIWHRNELMKTFVITENNLYSLLDKDLNIPVEQMITSLQNYIYSLNFCSLADNFSEIYDYLRKINFVLDDNFENNVKGDWEIFKISLENDFNKTIKYYSYLSYLKPEMVEYLIDMAIKANYVALENTPSVLLKSKKFLFNSMKLDPKSIMYFDRRIAFSLEEKNYIREFLINNKIYYYMGIFDFLENDYEFIKLSVTYDPAKMEIINDINLNDVQKNELIQIFKVKVLDGSYTLNEKLPAWVFYDEDLLSELMKKPELLKKYKLDYTLDGYKLLFDKGISVNNNPYTILNNILHNIDLIDVLDINSQMVYPQELLEQIIDKLIAKHYIVNERTPQILLYNVRFVTYALENNMKVDDQYIENIIDFEKIYEYQNVDIVKKYCLLGYGKRYRSLFDKLGIDEALQLAAKYGYLISLINFDSNISIDNIEKCLQSVIDNNSLIDFIIRTNYQLTEEEIIYGIVNKNGRMDISRNDRLFRYLLKDDPNRIELYKGNSTKIFELAFAFGYQLTLQSYQQRDNFKENDYVTKIGLDIDCNFIKYYKGDNPELFKYAISKGFKISEQLFIDNPHLCETYLLLSAIDSPEASKYILFYNGYSEEVFEKALLHGYVPTIEDLTKKGNFCRSSLLVRRVMQDDIKAIMYYQGSDIEAFKDIFELVDKNGNKIVPDRETMKELRFIYGNDELMRKAILYDCNNIIFYTGYDESLYELAIKQGYIPKKEDLELNNRLYDKDVIFKKIIEIGNKELLLYYAGNNAEIVQEIYVTLLKEQYSLIIKNDDDLKNYISVWQSFNTNIMHERLLTYMNYDNVIAFKSMPIDYYLVLKYGINNDKMDYLIKIIKAGNINDFANIYSYLVKKYLELNNNAFGVDLFLKIARLYVIYPNLLDNIFNRELNDVEVANLIKIINSDVKFSEVNSLDDLAKLDEKLIDSIRNSLDSCNDPKEIKNMILRYVFNIDYDEFMHILTNYINFDTLDKIISKAEKLNNQEELLYEASMLKILLKMLEETINATNDIESLKALLRNYLDNQELVNKVRPLYYDLKERIRNIYELDANATLTDISSLTPDENGVIDLQNSEYTIYAHVMSGKNFEEYVKYRFNGKVTICVSPISNLGKKLYSNSGVILGFVKIPRGGFVGSSNRNMSSNGFIHDNDYQVHDDRFYHLEIKDSSSLTPREHPETLLYRDGLLPGCIIIRGEVPSQEEKDAQQAFRDLGLELPFVHTQAIGNVAELKGKDIAIVDPQEDVDRRIYVEQSIELGEYKAKLDKIKKVREKVLELKEYVEGLGIKQEEIYDLIPMKIGGSHDMFKCHIKGKDGVFYLKPGYRKGRGEIDPYRSYAMEAGYRIQSIVNPEGAVYVDTVMVSSESLGYGSTDEDILCSVIEVKQDTTSYNGWATSGSGYSELSEKEMSSFMQELISDYLLFSYDTKPENFLKDKNGNTFGIDKEQALKFILNPLFVQRDSENNLTFNTSFAVSTSSLADFNGCGIIYIKIFDAIQEGKQRITEENVNKAMAAISRVEAISDEEYKQIFKNYVDDFAKSSVVSDIVNKYKNAGYSDEEAIAAVKNELYESLLARKNNLRAEFTLFINNVLTTYYSKIGEEVPEWVTNLSQEKKI